MDKYGTISGLGARGGLIWSIKGLVGTIATDGLKWSKIDNMEA